MTDKPSVFFWFRRDLRLHDNTGLAAAIETGLPVQCVFIFDTNILHQLENKRDARMLFIHRQLTSIDKQLRKVGGGLRTFYGDPKKIWEQLGQKENISSVYANHDYEPYARNRDEKVQVLLHANGISFHKFKDQVIFEKSEIIKDDGSPYTVFTPYKKKWLSNFTNQHITPAKSIKSSVNFRTGSVPPIHTLQEIGFETFEFDFTDPAIDNNTLVQYSVLRDYPAAAGTTRISMHLRFGVVSIREIVEKSINAKSDTYLNELIWREFYMMILWHFPHVANSAFKKPYERIPWINDHQAFERWCTGTTGYPIVDAGMRELNATGFMHNRVRMIVASFLTKHLLTDWRWGEAYFASNLLDYELSSNNGGWQWAAGSGCDAAPYFRIFNPTEQARKFDPQFEYIRKWVPEFEDSSYPAPIVDHKFARERCLETYKKALNG